MASRALRTPSPFIILLPYFPAMNLTSLCSSSEESSRGSRILQCVNLPSFVWAPEGKGREGCQPDTVPGYGGDNIDGPVHTRSQVPSHLRSIRAISAVESMEVGTYHFTRGTQVLSPNYDMDAYMATLLGGELGTCVRSGVHQRAIPNSQHKSCKYFMHK